MATIDTMTDSGQPHPAQPAAPQHPATSPPEPADSAAGAQDRVGTARQPRPLLIPLPTAITAALVAGLFGLLFLNLNSLNDNITTLHHDTNNSIDALDAKIDNKTDSLRDDMNERIDALRDEMTAGFREINATLLDHTDRLARIETHLDLRPHTDTTDP